MNTMTPRRPTPDEVLPAHRDLFYGGAWHAPVAGRYQSTLNPSTGEEVMAVAVGDAADAEAAIRSAHAAFASWRRTTPAQRQALMRQVAHVIRSHAEELAMLDAINTGNPVAEMVADAHASAAGIEYFAGLITELKGETLPIGQNSMHYTVREPLGVVARIVAYNHPLMFAAMKIGAPLAAGNTVVLKAAEQAPLSALRMAELVGDILPPGVLNVLCGSRECGQALSSHPLVRKITLIGSVNTGKAIMKTASDTLKPVLLELGGKNALIAYPDADVDAVIDGCVRGMNFTWAGQSCGSTSRAFIHESLYDRVVQGVADLTASRHKPGIATDWNTTMGPLISRQQCDRVLGFIADAKAEGARLVCGGGQPAEPALRNGYFVEPTLFADVTPSMRVAREEVFGPVLSFFKWREEDEMFEAVNDTEYGLTAAIFTHDIATAHLAAGRVEAGYVWVNEVSRHFLGTPFGGYKQSGIGREECFEELLEFSQVKSVHVKLRN